MPTLTIASSPSNLDHASVDLFFRDYGQGAPLLILHGGWGYGIYPFDLPIARLVNDFRVLIPDRSGYGRSTQISGFAIDFHQRAAEEMLLFLDELGIERTFLWGHSEGAVIAAKMALAAPDRVEGIVFEAFHFFRAKQQSRELFRVPAQEPGRLSERVRATLAVEHGDPYWSQLLHYSGSIWLQIIESAERTGKDLYAGQLARVQAPCCFIHGGDDPFTQPGELDAVRLALPDAAMHVMSGVGHSPHSESASAAACTDVAEDFLVTLLSQHNRCAALRRNEPR